MTIVGRINTCRYCGKRAHADWLIKYGTRAYAHPDCYMANKTVKDAAALPLFEKRKLEQAIWERAAAKAELSKR